MKFKVIIIESERGWGQTVDSIKFFEGDNAATEAYKFQEDFNKENKENTGNLVPDWYMMALEPVRVG